MESINRVLRSKAMHRRDPPSPTPVRRGRVPDAAWDDGKGRDKLRGQFGGGPRLGADKGCNIRGMYHENFGGQVQQQPHHQGRGIGIPGADGVDHRHGWRGLPGPATTTVEEAPGSPESESDHFEAKTIGQGLDLLLGSAMQPQLFRHDR